jgi:hypothetical protein
MIELRPYGSPSFDEAVPQGQPIVETPLQELDRNHCVITQRYMQHILAYKRPSENARMPREILPDLGVLAYHCYDGPRTPINGSQIIEFDRVWATVPTGFEEPQVFTVTGKQPSSVAVLLESTYYSPTNIVNTVTNLGIKTVGGDITMNAKAQRDFFLVGQNGSYLNTSLIPVRNEQVKLYYDWSSTSLGVKIKIAFDFATLTNSAPYQTVPITSGYIVFPPVYGLGAGSVTTYLSRTSMTTETISGSLVYGESKLFRYIGNIWERRSVNATIV